MAEVIVFIICACSRLTGCALRSARFDNRAGDHFAYRDRHFSLRNFIIKIFPDSQSRLTDQKNYLDRRGIILIATIAGIIVAPSKLAALGIARAYFWEPMIFSFLLIKIQPDGKKIFKAALYGFALNATLVAGYGIFQYFFPRLIPATYVADHRITSFYSYPMRSPFTSRRSFRFSFGALVFAACCFRRSRNYHGQISWRLIAVFAALFVAGLSFKKSRVATIIVTIVVAAMLSFAPQLSGLREQILMKDWSGRVHQIGWQESIAMLRDHPLWGAGLSGYPTAVKPYTQPLALKFSNTRTTFSSPSGPSSGCSASSLSYYLRVVFLDGIQALQATTYNLQPKTIGCRDRRHPCPRPR